MTGLHYPDNLYADHEERKARRSQQPTGAYDGRGAGSPPWRPGHGFIDPVTKPAHYQRAGIETIDYIRATLGDGFEAYCIGNVLKYVSRYREKGGIEDLRKAQVYLGWAIEPVKAEPNPAAMREAKVAYDVACDDEGGFISGGLVRFKTLEEKTAFERECVDILKSSVAVIREHVPKWDPRWGVPLTERKGYSQGSHTGTTGPIPQNQPPNCDGLSARDVRAPHPMQAETIRDHDERLSGGEDRL